MKHINNFVVFALALSLFCMDVRAGELRTWTSAGGARMEAEFVETDGKDVVLKTTDGTLTKITKDRLSKADQEYVNSMSGGGQDGAVETQQFSPDSLPVFKDEQWRQELSEAGNRRSGMQIGAGKQMGRYASYKREKFEAIVDQNGMLWIVLLDDDGKEIPYRIKCHWEIYCHVSRGGRQINEIRKVQEFLNPAPPTSSPNIVKVNALLEDNVKVEMVYEFKGDAVTASGQVIDPKGISMPSRFSVYWMIPPSHVFEIGTSLAEQARQTSHCRLAVATESTAKTASYKYHEAISISTRSVKHVEIAGHWRPRVVTFYPAGKNETIMVGNYGKVALYNGCTVHNEPWEHTEHAKQKLTIEVK